MAYAAALTAAAGAALLQPAAQPSSAPAYLGVGAGLLAGVLQSVRLRPGDAGATLLLIPAIVADARFGASALPALGYAALVGTLLRGVRGAAVLSLAAESVLAYAGAELVVNLVAIDGPVRIVVFGLAFVLAQQVLRRMSQRLGGPGLEHPQADHPDLLISVCLAPLAALPLLAYARFGDGGLALGLAALLAMLALVVEARNLATARAEAEAARDQLARANALQRDLVHLITHELKNPLTSVLVYTQLLEKAVRDQQLERVPTHIGRIHNSARSIQRLVDNLLQLIRLEETGELPPSEPVEVATLAHDVAAELESLAEQKQQTLVVDVRDLLPQVLAPPLLLTEALSNLVSNAIKYTPEGGEVRVWARREVDKGGVLLGVTDTGIGMSAQDLARVFDKFFRSSDPRARAERGSGLGLALTQAIIKRLGGTIEVESRLNEGTTFRIALPAEG